MFRHSLFGKGTILVMVLTLFGTTFGGQTNDTRTELRLSSFAQSKVLLIGLLDHNLLIITKDSPPMLYEIPMTKYVNNQIDLYEVVPVELKDKWPVLYSNDIFTNQVLSEELAKSFSIGMDKETFVFAFNNYAVKNNILTVTFTFRPPNATYREFLIYDDEFFLSQAHIISSDEPNVFYRLKITNRGTTYRLSKFSFNNADGFKPEWKFDMCKSSNGNGSIGEVVFNPLYSQCSYINWKIKNGGFVYQNRFHLFTKDQVYIFEYTGSGNSTGVVFKVVKLTDFFTSVGNSIAITNLKVSISTIFFIVAGLIVLVATAICMFFFKKATNKHGQNSASYEMDQNLQPLTPKESLNDSAAAGEQSNLTDIGTSVSPKAMKN